METARFICTAAAAVAGLIAGVAWLISTRVGTENRRQPPIEGTTADGAVTVRFGKRYLLLYPTLRQQSTWNSYAAIAASVSAFAQVALLFR
ncbi:hypothetical protein FOHLNKBM_5336 [Methylobacterium longum]|nr:hypothetical protein FOHLNKBM_5336 [Methylobacterium longum]